MVFVVTVASCYSKFKVSTNRTSLPAVLLTLNICFFSWSTCHVVLGRTLTTQVPELHTYCSQSLSLIINLLHCWLPGYQYMEVTGTGSRPLHNCLHCMCKCGITVFSHISLHHIVGLCVSVVQTTASVLQATLLRMSVAES